MEAGEVAEVVESKLSVSDKIRALAAAGHPRAEIARILGKRYQHVRNVLEADKLHSVGSPRPAQGVAETSPPFAGPQPAADVQDRGGGAYRLAVRLDGSIVLPVEVRSALALSGASAVMARLEGEEFRLFSAATAWRRIDELMAPYKWKGGPLASDELIAERRAAAERE